MSGLKVGHQTKLREKSFQHSGDCIFSSIFKVIFRLKILVKFFVPPRFFSKPLVIQLIYLQYLFIIIISYMIKNLVMFSLSPKKVLFYWQAQKSQAHCPPTALVYFSCLRVSHVFCIRKSHCITQVSDLGPSWPYLYLKLVEMLSE